MNLSQMASRPIVRTALRAGISLGLLVASATALALGGIDSGGGDNKAVSTGSLWFQRPGVITYCIRVSGDFGATDSDAQQAFESAFQAWKTYFSTKLPGATYTAYDPQTGTSAAFSLFTNTLTRNATCNGNEDLTLLMGVDTPESTAAKRYYENPTAFTNLSSFDLKSLWGKGFIWVTATGKIDPKAGFPNWAAPMNLRGIMLHEVGHIVGVGHVTGTIMTDEISELLKPMTGPEEQVRQHDLATIDHDKELLVCDTCTFARTSNFAGLADGMGGDLFKRLTGRAPQGNVVAVFQQWSDTDPRADEGTMNQYDGIKGTITLTDDIGTVTLTFCYDPYQGEEYQGSAEIFRHLDVLPPLTLDSTEPVVKPNFLADGGGSYFGTLLAPNGRTFPMILSRNLRIRPGACQADDAIGDRSLAVYIVSSLGKERVY